MVHWSRFRALSMRGVLHPINTQHNNCRYSWIHFHSYPYYQYKFRGLSPSVNHTHSLSLGRPEADCSLPFIWVWYEKCSKIDCHTPQLRYPCTKYQQDNNHYYLPSTYIAKGTNPKITISCILPCTRSESGLRHCISFEGGSTSTTITSKNQHTRKHQIDCA